MSPENEGKKPTPLVSGRSCRYPPFESRKSLEKWLCLVNSLYLHRAITALRIGLRQTFTCRSYVCSDPGSLLICAHQTKPCPWRIYGWVANTTAFDAFQICKHQKCVNKVASHLPLSMAWPFWRLQDSILLSSFKSWESHPTKSTNSTAPTLLCHLSTTWDESQMCSTLLCKESFPTLSKSAVGTARACPPKCPRNAKAEQLCKYGVRNSKANTFLWRFAWDTNAKNSRKWSNWIPIIDRYWTTIKRSCRPPRFLRTRGQNIEDTNLASATLQWTKALFDTWRPTPVCLLTVATSRVPVLGPRLNISLPWICCSVVYAAIWHFPKSRLAIRFCPKSWGLVLAGDDHLSLRLLLSQPHARHFKWHLCAIYLSIHLLVCLSTYQCARHSPLRIQGKEASCFFKMAWA